MTASYCVECGPNVKVDEDGCCAACGGNAMGEFADRACAALAEVARLKDRLKDRQRRLGVVRKALLARFPGPGEPCAWWLRVVYDALDLRRSLSKPKATR